jgi:hypothetical protein
MGVGDTAPPDEEMIRRAEQIVGYVQDQTELIADIVYGHYLWFVSLDPEWFDDLGIPQGLDRAGVLEYVDRRALVVSRDLENDEAYESVVHIIPKWEHEHALFLTYKDGEIGMVNDEPFRLEDGLLVLGDKK